MEEKVILQVKSKGNDTYQVDVASNTTLSELAFGITVVIKCLIRDGYIKDKGEILNMVDKYLTDPEYNEEMTENEQI